MPVRLAPNQPREAGDSVWETELCGGQASCTAPPRCPPFAVDLIMNLLLYVSHVWHRFSQDGSWYTTSSHAASASCSSVIRASLASMA